MIGHTIGHILLAVKFYGYTVLLTDSFCREQSMTAKGPFLINEDIEQRFEVVDSIISFTKRTYQTYLFLLKSKFKSLNGKIVNLDILSHYSNYNRRIC